MHLRLLARAAPVVLGAVAAAIVLRRRRPQKPQPLALVAPPAPPAVTPPAPAQLLPAEPEEAPEAGLEEAPEEPPSPPTGRFARSPEGAPIDIVTVVDDLLEH